jgi:hypothetical protein
VNNAEVLVKYMWLNVPTDPTRKFQCGMFSLHPQKPEIFTLRPLIGSSRLSQYSTHFSPTPLSHLSLSEMFMLLHTDMWNVFLNFNLTSALMDFLSRFIFSTSCLHVQLYLGSIMDGLNNGFPCAAMLQSVLWETTNISTRTRHVFSGPKPFV